MPPVDKASLFSRFALSKAWKRIYRSKSSKKRKSSRGVDNITVQDFESNKEAYLEQLFSELQNDTFTFSQLYTYYQFRPGKKKSRIIQSPTVRDRIVLSVVNNYLATRSPASLFRASGVVGSVKGTTLRGLIRNVLSFEREGHVAVFKTDVKDFFPSINVPRLKKALSHYLREEPYVRKIITDFLSINDQPGVPQGSAISPLLANIYLFAFDKQLSKKKESRHLRYVDDIIIFSKNGKDFRSLYKLVKGELRGKGLRIHPFVGKNSKTRVGLLRSGRIDILGILFSKKGLKIKQDKVSKFRAELAALINVKKVLKFRKVSIMLSLKKFIEGFNFRISGWASAYAICDELELYKQLDIEIQRKFVGLFDSIAARRHLVLRTNTRSRVLASVVSMEDIRMKVRSRQKWSPY